jgi:hypothetical protein
MNKINFIKLKMKTLMPTVSVILWKAFTRNRLVLDPLILYMLLGKQMVYLMLLLNAISLRQNHVWLEDIPS